MMRLVAGRLAAHLGLTFALIMAVLVSSGCDDDRKPPPAIYVVVLSEPQHYLVNQQRLDQAGFETEMRKLADENRRSLTGQVRAYVYIDAERSADFYRTDGIADFCQRLGFMNVVRSSAGMK